MDELRKGSRIGRYTVTDVLGRGGMGAVYLAQDGERVVAVKVPSSEACQDQDLLQRFKREARALAALRHPHVTVIHDVGEERGVPFMVLEHVAGGSLSGHLRARGGRLPWREVAALGAKIASALAAVHAAGLVHRDVKP